MNAMAVVKTAAGMQSLSERDKRLSSKARMLLVTVDGGYDEVGMREIARGIGAPPDTYDQLLNLGLIGVELQSSAPRVASADAPPALDAFGKFRMASAIMNELASDAIGLKAFFFVLKVERCGSIEDLAKLIPTLEPAVVKAHGESSARLLLKPLKQLVTGHSQ